MQDEYKDLDVANNLPQTSPSVPKRNILLTIIIVLLVISNVATVLYFIVFKNMGEQIVTEIVESKTEKFGDTVTEGQSDDEEYMQGANPNDESNLDQGSLGHNAGEKETVVISNKNQLEKYLNISDNELLIEWDDEPTLIDASDLFNQTTLEKFIAKNIEDKNKPDTVESFDESMKIHKLGTTLNGENKNNSLFMLTFSSYREDEMASGKTYILEFIKTGNGFVLLDKYSSNDWNDYRDVFTEVDQSEILNLEPSQTVLLPEFNTEITLREEKISNYFFQDIKNLKFLFEKDGRKFFRRDDSACIITSANDGTMREYFFGVDFIQVKEKDSSSLSTPHILNITWSNGVINTSDYFVVDITGCGGKGSCFKVANYIEDIGQLSPSGKTSKGDTIYEFKDPENDAMAKKVLKEMYGNYYSNKQKISFDQFLLDHPLVFWQDPFGDFMEFKKADYQAAVECGKPVIYLYPEKEIDAEVYVAPTGGFTITEPAYNNGWKVKAKPSGEIYNYADKKTYPYLFWEGHGVDYQRPSEGFVVARAEVLSFLEEKLAQLGLIKNEYDEFIEFWLPKMQEKPHYFITFMPQAEFEKIAPLNVIPKPDTVIRVFMDYEGLDRRIEVKEPKIKTPQRKGFTVVEWGGALHR